jgi:hypothetical protein
MGQTVDIGSRIELVSMDSHFHDISIALHRQDRDNGPEFMVHTYSGFPGADQRIEFVTRTMAALGDMELTAAGLLRFPCGAEHAQACKRLFLEACKLDPSAGFKKRPLHIFDKKAACNISVSSLGEGVYRVTAENEDQDRRISAIAGGLIKLGQMQDQAADQVAFSCGFAHDALLGLLLVRAPNVRAILREQEQTSSRGVLAAPSQQE